MSYTDEALYKNSCITAKYSISYESGLKYVEDVRSIIKRQLFERIASHMYDLHQDTIMERDVPQIGQVELIAEFFIVPKKDLRAVVEIIVRDMPMDIILKIKTGPDNHDT